MFLQDVCHFVKTTVCLTPVGFGLWCGYWLNEGHAQISLNVANSVGVVFFFQLKISINIGIVINLH